LPKEGVADIDKARSAAPSFRLVCPMSTLVLSVRQPPAMSTSYFQERGTPASASQNGLSPASPHVGTGSRGVNALSSRITSVLSASYADLEIRGALETLDERSIQNTAETRRQIRLDVQKEVIECNGEIVKDFGQVAEVCLCFNALCRLVLSGYSN
jgi:hypothetical protein